MLAAIYSAFFWGIVIDRMIEPTRINNTTPSEINVGISKISLSNIFTPIKTSTTQTPVERYRNR
jgi:hypothetical protein